jgi:nitrite reductase/ring-hydroxylating ferredoxin subunit
MGWTKVLSVDALAPGTKQAVKVGTEKILLVNHEGELYAVSNICPHMKLPLSKGKITESGDIVCPFHRSVFCLKSGEVSTWTPFPPGVGTVLGMISKPKNLPVFPTRVEEGSIWVDV